ncbi:MAG TPA: dienelactone hydrolase family protein [Gemmatales bacterium]|nr:dienelactone hydrolase family protein [Gemmatales bacterium]
MLRLLSLILFLFIPTLALAQPERHELGRRLRLFEEAWEAQKDAAIRKEPAANMNAAVMLFFGLRLGEAGRALDQGLVKLQGIEERDVRLTTNLRCLWLKADSHWLELSTKTLKVKVDRFYPLEEPRINEVSYAYSWVPKNKPVVEMTDNSRVRDDQVIDGVSKTAFIPGEIELTIPEKVGDYTLRFAWKALGNGEPHIAAEYCTISLSKNRDQRLSQLKEAVAKWPTPYATSDEVSVSLNVKVLERLAKGETLETDYAADRLLKECEEAVVAIAKKEPYYHTSKVGQFWMGVQTPTKKIVPLRIQTVKVKPGQKVPVVLALHGAGGSENLFFDGYGNGKVAKLAQQKGWFVVAPRNSLTKAGHAETITELAKLFPEIDTNQVFVVGHSMGAAEAIREANATPGKFAAVAALGGGGSPKPVKDQGEAFKKLPFYVGVGENDFASSQAEALSENLKKAGADEVTFKRYPAIEHMIIVQEALPEVFQFFEVVQKARTK